MGNNSFTVLPMSQRFFLEPGETYTGEIAVVNPADATEDFAYQAAVTPYSVTEEDYTADLTTDHNRSMITKWIKINEPTGIVAPNESRIIKFTITVPENAPSGGQYATITVASNNNFQSSGSVSVQNIFEIASVIYANVAGETVHSGEILENNIPGFVTTIPVRLTASISNNGNVHEDATFVITVSDLFTGRVVLTTEENNGQYNELIMPETTKQIDREVSNLPTVGIIKINQTIYYNGEVSIVEKNVIICPIWFMILFVTIIISVIVSVIMIVRKHKKNKKIQTNVRS